LIVGLALHFRTRLKNGVLACAALLRDRVKLEALDLLPPGGTVGESNLFEADNTPELAAVATSRGALAPVPFLAKHAVFTLVDAHLLAVVLTGAAHARVLRKGWSVELTDVGSTDVSIHLIGSRGCSISLAALTALASVLAHSAVGIRGNHADFTRPASSIGITFTVFASREIFAGTARGGRVGNVLTWNAFFLGVGLARIGALPTGVRDKFKALNAAVLGAVPAGSGAVPPVGRILSVRDGALVSVGAQGTADVGLVGRTDSCLTAGRGTAARHRGKAIREVGALWNVHIFSAVQVAFAGLLASPVPGSNGRVHQSAGSVNCSTGSVTENARIRRASEGLAAVTRYIALGVALALALGMAAALHEIALARDPRNALTGNLLLEDDLAIGAGELVASQSLVALLRPTSVDAAAPVGGGDLISGFTDVVVVTLQAVQGRVHGRVSAGTLRAEVKVPRALGAILAILGADRSRLLAEQHSVIDLA
jgi:hypothetical protein